MTGLWATEAGKRVAGSDERCQNTERITAAGLFWKGKGDLQAAVRIVCF